MANNDKIKVHTSISKQGIVRWKRYSGAALLAAVLWLPAGLHAAPAAQPASEPTGSQLGQATGPTLRLGDSPEGSSWNPMSTFMYFVRLISPEPVKPVSSPGSTQAVRVTSTQHRAQEGNKFTVTRDFEFAGDGVQQNLFDLTRQIRRHQQQLNAGGSLEKQLRSITVEGQGKGSVKVEGTINNGVKTVTEVRLQFNGQGQPSPVSINLCDIRRNGANYRAENELVARVNSLTFRRNAGPPKMEVAIASVKSKDAGNSWWQNLKGRVKGAAANMMLDPLAVQTVGYRTMLEFGQALVNEASTFTFPRAGNGHANQGLLGLAN